MHMCAHLRRLKANSRPGYHGHTTGAIRISVVVVFRCPFFLLRNVLSLNIGLTVLSRLGGQKVPEMHCTQLLNRRMQGRATVPGFKSVLEMGLWLS